MTFDHITDSTSWEKSKTIFDPVTLKSMDVKVVVYLLACKLDFLGGKHNISYDIIAGESSSVGIMCAITFLNMPHHHGSSTELLHAGTQNNHFVGPTFYSDDAYMPYINLSNESGAVLTEICKIWYI